MCAQPAEKITQGKLPVHTGHFPCVRTVTICDMPNSFPVGGDVDAHHTASSRLPYNAMLCICLVIII